MLGNVSVADKKGRGLKVTATKLYQCFGVQENISFQEQKYLFFFFFAIVYFHLREASTTHYYERLLLA